MDVAPTDESLCTKGVGGRKCAPAELGKCLSLRTSLLFMRTFLQVKTHWDWPNVHQADYYLETMEAMKDRNASRAE